MQFVMAVVLLGIADATAALIGLLEYSLGVVGPVELLKNAAYANFSTYEILGLARITGTFPEASAFAGFTMPLLAFIASLWRSGFRPKLTGPLGLLLLSLLVFSTSTTAYVSLAGYGGCLIIGRLWKTIILTQRAILGWGAALAGSAVVMLCLAALLTPEMFATVWHFLETVVVNKLDSSSGIERSSWNAQAWANTLDTYGLGAGLGSVRASSLPFVLLSNVGFLGTLFFLVFVFRAASFTNGPLDESTSTARLASRHAMLANLIAATVSSAVFDLGLAFYAFAAVAATHHAPNQNAQAENYAVG